MSNKKTNAMRLLDAENIIYETLYYPVVEEHLDGIFASEQVGLPPEQVYKTLVTQGENQYIICLIPVNKTLNLKALARAAGIKRLEMAPLHKIQQITGYQRGGCSPIGMRKEYPRFIDQQAKQQKNIAISGGTRGTQVFLNPEDLISFCHMTSGDFTLEDV